MVPPTQLPPWKTVSSYILKDTDVPTKRPLWTDLSDEEWVEFRKDMIGGSILAGSLTPAQLAKSGFSSYIEMMLCYAATEWR